MGWPNVIEDVDVSAAARATLGLGRIGPSLDLGERSVLNVASIGPREDDVRVGWAEVKLNKASAAPIEQRARARRMRDLKRNFEGGFLCMRI